MPSIVLVLVLVLVLESTGADSASRSIASEVRLESVQTLNAVPIRARGRARARFEAGLP